MVNPAVPSLWQRRHVVVVGVSAARRGLDSSDAPISSRTYSRISRPTVYLPKDRVGQGNVTYADTSAKQCEKAEVRR